MKLITLNTWGGRVKEFNQSFFETYSGTDIWCFQEMYHGGISEVKISGLNANHHLFEEIEKYLPEYKSLFCNTCGIAYGIAAFTHKNINVIASGENLVAKGNWEDDPDLHNRDHHRKLQWLEIKIDGKKLLIVNVHLTHRPEGKGDSEKRLKQSKIIIDFLNMFDCPKILCGDFNLLPETESIKMFENAGLKSLIKEYNITSTRTELYKKEWRFADYVFVSPGIKVKDFKVLPDIVSDHSPLYLDFDLDF